MRRKPYLLPVLAIVAGMSAMPGPAGAQCRLCDTPVTTRDDGPASARVTLEIETALDFDRLILFGSGEGTATLRPDGSRSFIATSTTTAPATPQSRSRKAPW